jgi:hypothetical protein
MFDADINDRRWAAVAARDHAADGDFYCCVRTTGVYCRPSCAARPKRENVFFVATRREAEAAGCRPCKRCRPERLATGPLEQRIGGVDWGAAQQELDAVGFARLGRLLDDRECAQLADCYLESGFRSTVKMDRHGFGAGEYKYFADPPPPMVEALRRELYERLVPVANQWRVRLGSEATLPATHEAYRRQCAARGQRRPTCLLLSYAEGDYNRLHQDLYGEEVFPIQAAVLLSEPGSEFEGGEFVLTEQRPRMQSRVHVVPLRKGDAVAFAVSSRPVEGGRGTYRAVMRHGVSTVRKGRRMTLGVIFHDAA